MRRFILRADKAGILHLPQGGVRQSIYWGKSYVKSYAAQHVRGWYAYAKRQRRFSTPQGSLYLIDKCIKTNAWGIAVFIHPRPHARRLLLSDDYSLDFKTENRGDAEFVYNWESHYDVATRVEPTPASSGGSFTAPVNQCIYIRGYKLLLRKRDSKVGANGSKRPGVGRILLSRLFGKLFSSAKTGKPTNRTSGDPHTNISRGSTHRGSQNSMASGLASNWSTHPSDIINEFLLQEVSRIRFFSEKMPYHCKRWLIANWL